MPQTNSATDAACYTYTCRSKVNLVPIREGSSVLVCQECHDLFPLHEAACERLGVEAWDETFVVFREGVFAGRRSAAKN